MYYYIVDPQKISQKEFERVQNILYSSLSEYRISGEVVRATGVRTINQLVENAFIREVKTLVAVGSEETLFDVINAIRGREVVVGFIPLVPGSVEKNLGIRDIEHAVKTIANRRVAEINLGKVNETLFISQLTFGWAATDLKGFWPKANHPEFELKFSANDQFSGSLKITGGVIVNSFSSEGFLDLILIPKVSHLQILRYRQDLKLGNFQNLPGSSILHVQKIEITEPAQLPLKTVNRIIVRTPCVIESQPKRLKIIVSKDRSGQNV